MVSISSRSVRTTEHIDLVSVAMRLKSIKCLDGVGSEEATTELAT